MRERYALLLLFLLALVPRVLIPGAFITVDEAYHWFERAGEFLRALQQGDYAGTNIIGHPGVTTMWLGAAGHLAHQTAAAAGWLKPDDPTLYYAFLRCPVGIVTALCVVLAFPLLRRLWGQRMAWLAALLWAADPFLVAHSKILHVDALLASLMILALLAALVAFRLDHAEPSPLSSRIHWPMLAASAVAGGLALLTKSPSALLPPVVGLVALVSAWRASDHREKAPGKWFLVLGSRFLVCLAWAVIALAVWFLLWPAAWVDPVGAVERMVAQVRYEGAEPHGWGNFFLGQPVEDPGPLFYLVAVPLRLTPWTLAGLLAAVVVLLPRHRSRPGYSALVLLALFALLFTVMLTLPPKKFDRYALPIFPVLAILAAAGLVYVWDKVQERIPAQHARAFSRLPLAFVLLVAANIAWYHPYELAYYNPLLGGGAVAPRLVPVGWGEGLGEAGRYISRQWNGCHRPVASWFQPALEPFTCTPVLHLSEAARPGRVDYAVLYIDQVQRNNVPDITVMLQQMPPVHTVHIHGINYAWIYQIPLPLEHRPLANFDRSIRLHSYTVDSPAIRSSGVLTLTTQWQARAPVSTDYMLFVHVLDAQGQRVGQTDAPPGGPAVPTSTWPQEHYVTWHHPVPVPADLPAGRYWLTLGLYNPQDFTRLPLETQPPPGAPDDGDHALPLGPFMLP